jgi:membrane protease subunit HflC
MRYFKMILALTVALILCAALVLFTVDRTEYVYVTRFGHLVKIYDGKEDAGLHFRWPWPIHSVQRLDRRLQVFDLPETEFLTRDDKGETIDKTLTIDAYVCWRISDTEGVRQFIRAVGTPDRAQEILQARIISRIGAVISHKKMDDLISVPSRAEEAHDRMDRFRDQLLNDPEIGGSLGETTSLIAQARNDYGIEIVDVRIRRTNHPPQVREAIFARIRSERSKKVADYQGEGALLAAQIKSEAERDARNIITEARAKDLELRGQADAQADRIRNLAHSKDAEFYAFLKKLEEYQRVLGDNKTVLLLSSHRELFDVLFQPPRPAGNGKSKSPVGSLSSRQKSKGENR